MGTKIQVLPGHNVDDASTSRATPARHARHVLLFTWTMLVACPWVLQIRSFSQLLARHKITQTLIPSIGTPAIYAPVEVTSRCACNGMLLAGVWWVIHPTHYYDTEDNDSKLCHFVVPQYNIHGVYNIKSHSTTPATTAPRRCASDSYPVSYYFYHGSIGYYALYAEGQGSYCSQDHTIYTTTTAVGSIDKNFSALAKYEGTPGYHSSYVFGSVGLMWLTYRAIVLTRSFLSCSRYGRRLDGLQESISVSNAVVYAQQAARLAPHAATNWHRLALVYFLVEGLMTDLFLLVAYDGFGVKLQYISLGYNIAGSLSMLFEMIENSKLLQPPTQLLAKRVLFNTELALKGELLFSMVLNHYLTGLS